jgi:DNA-binding transcriptional regulator LsrR (DeoR family)
MRTISQQALNWRRDRVRELTIKGWTQREIASELKIDNAMINRDLQFMRKQAKENIQHYIDEYLPAEYQYCLDTLNMIVKEMWDVKTEDNRELIQSRMLIKECCAMRIDLLSNAMVVGRAVQFIDRHRCLIPLPSSQEQQAEQQTD